MAFCRLEHVIPWVMRGAPWDPGGALARPAVEPSPLKCSECGRALAQPAALRLVRHRGAHRIPDAFCSLDHLRAWAVAGGRWRPTSE